MDHADFPRWLDLVSGVSLALGLVCAAAIAVDETGRRQSMWIMNLVWPLTALFGSVLWLWLYLRHGRGPTPAEAAERRRRGESADGGGASLLVAVAKGASHCGAGCTLGDIVAEWLAFAFPGLAVALGWGSLFQHKMFAVWILDFALAFALGVAFQYFTIKPMRELSVSQGILQALKADVASITAWQVGMFGFMALAQFAWFKPAYGGIAEVTTPEFWFVMQLAMLCGFATAYPVNWLLVKTGVKERM